MNTWKILKKLLIVIWNITQIILIIIALKEQKYKELTIILGTYTLYCLIKECYIQIKERTERAIERSAEEIAREIAEEMFNNQ